MHSFHVYPEHPALGINGSLETRAGGRHHPNPLSSRREVGSVSKFGKATAASCCQDQIYFIPFALTLGFIGIWAVDREDKKRTEVKLGSFLPVFRVEITPQLLVFFATFWRREGRDTGRGLAAPHRISFVPPVGDPGV